MTMGKRGVLLMNVGTPEAPTEEAVRRYLREFLLDPDVIDLPAPLRHLLVRGIILRTRPKRIAPAYAKIWMDEGAPLRVHSDRMVAALQERDGDLAVAHAFRYGVPSMQDGLEALRAEGVDELLLAPMFPQHAEATTGSAMKRAEEVLSDMAWAPSLRRLEHFETEPEYVQPLTASLQDAVDDGAHILFSYHGLPLSHVRRADPTRAHCQKVENCCATACSANAMCYAHHCNMTTSAVVEALGLPEDRWSLSYQSRIGPVKWLTPASTSAVVDLAKRGVTNVAVVAPAFVVDGLETLEELEIELRETFIEAGGKDFRVVPCLNDEPTWVAGVHSLIERAFVA
ncbi:MAG TPA: ferrochelatase [Candidatus Poseidoniales archaeon]|nr:MAG TPA: ferrochelatase [Candidatus Poseidoniales archaeon]